MAISIAEQVHLEAINRARAYPGAEADRLGIDLNEGLVEGTILDTPKPPLVFNDTLRDAAIAHSQDMLDNDFFDHIGSDNSTPGERITSAGYDWGQYAENLGGWTTGAGSSAYTAAQEMHDALFIDSGESGRGHRKTILDPNLREIGVGMVYGEFQGDDYTHLVTDDYATSFDSDTYFLTGVVFNDSNQDGLYTGGEGISGITVTVRQGETVVDSAVTGTAGEYNIALTPGSYTVTASLAAPAGDVTEAVTVINSNVKVDFRYHATITSLPGVSLVCSESDIVVMSSETAKRLPVNIEGASESAKLMWDTSEAYLVTLNGYPVGPTGSQTVAPVNSTTYELTVYGAAGVVTKSVTVRVHAYPPFDSDKNKFPMDLR